jgi:hypothetical protein
MTFQPYAQPIVINHKALDPNKINNADLNRMSDRELLLELEYTDRRCTELVLQMEQARQLWPQVTALPTWRLRELYNETSNRYKDIKEEIQLRHIP